MKVIYLLYNLILGILASLGLPFGVTSLLASISLAAIALGIVIVSPQLALIIGIILLVSILLQS
jgi:hypothetical protein